MALRATFKLIQKASLPFDANLKDVPGLCACFEEAAKQVGSTAPIIRNLHDSFVENDAARVIGVKKTSRRG